MHSYLSLAKAGLLSANVASPAASPAARAIRVAIVVIVSFLPLIARARSARRHLAEENRLPVEKFQPNAQGSPRPCLAAQMRGPPSRPRHFFLKLLKSSAAGHDGSHRNGTCLVTARNRTPSSHVPNIE